MLISVGIVFGSIFIYKVFLGWFINKKISQKSHVITVSTIKVGTSKWEKKISSSGSFRAIHGVNVTTELAGMVKEIKFIPGSMVHKNDLLVQLNIDSEIAQLHSIEANAQLAAVTYQRDKAQYAIHAISKQQLDNDIANLKNLQAQVAQQQAVIAKKTIRAPFSGQLGINYVNLGQFLNPGDAIVTLQTLDPIYIDFYVPQQHLHQVKNGQKIVVTVDGFSNSSFTGKITTINPLVDVATRNVEVEATIANPKNQLKPGMFGTVDIILGQSKSHITVPQTVISFNPYGDVVYLVKKTNKGTQEQPILKVAQHFVVTGETRGDQIQVLKGLHVNDVVVSSGQLKLKNGSQIAINNSIQPFNNPNPKLKNNH